MFAVWAGKALYFEDYGLQFQKFDDAYLDSLRKGDRRTEEHFVLYFSELIHLKLRSRLNSRDAIEDVRRRHLPAFLCSCGARRACVTPRHSEHLSIRSATTCSWSITARIPKAKRWKTLRRWISSRRMPTFWTSWSRKRHRRPCARFLKS